MSKRRDLAMIVAILLAGCAPPAQSIKPVMAPQAAAPTRLLQQAHVDTLGETITTQIRAVDPVAFRAVTAKALGGRLLLTGAVVKPEQRRRAERAAAAIPGVVAVSNEVLLAEEKAFDLFTPDIAHEAALAARLAADSSTGTGALELRVVNHVAYLVATPRSPDQTARIKELLTEDSGVKWVVLVTQP